MEPLCRVHRAPALNHISRRAATYQSQRHIRARSQRMPIRSHRLARFPQRLPNMNTNPKISGANAMTSKLVSFVRRMLVEQRGDVAPLLAVSMTALLGMGGLTIDV